MLRHELTTGRPLLALAMGESADGETLMELHAALGRLAESAPVKDLPGTTAHLDALGSRLNAQLVLDCLEMHTRAWLRRQAPVVLRSRRGHDALRALDEFAQLRAAQRAGSNPNADLLRHRALVATMAALAGDAAA